MVKLATFAECRPLLGQLWPSGFDFIDNIHGMIHYAGTEYRNMKLQHFLWIQEGQAVGTTHCYTTGFGLVRVRGTYFIPTTRGKGWAKVLVQTALSHFSDCHMAYTFPRTGTEQFYQSLGFSIRDWPSPSFESKHGYGYAECQLNSHLL